MRERKYYHVSRITHHPSGCSRITHHASDCSRITHHASGITHRGSTNLGSLYGEVSASEKAIHHLKQALPIFETLGDSKGLLLVHINLAEQQLQLEQLDSALKQA